MATKITLPTALSVHSFRLDEFSAGRKRIPLEHTGEVDVINRGGSLWQATVTFNVIPDPTQQQAAYRALKQLTSAAHYADLTLELESPLRALSATTASVETTVATVGPAGVVNADGDTDTQWAIALASLDSDSATTTARNPSPVVKGGFIEIAGNLYQVANVLGRRTTANDHNTVFTVDPVDRRLLINVGDTVVAPAAFKCRLSDDSINMLRRINWTERFTLTFNEFRADPVSTNRIPEVTTEPPEEIRVVAGRTRALRLAGTARSPEGNRIQYETSVENSRVATVSHAVGETPTFNAKHFGTSLYTVTYTDVVTGEDDERTKLLIVTNIRGNIPPETVGSPGTIAGAVGDEPRRFNWKEMVSDVNNDELTATPSSTNTAVARVEIDGDEAIVRLVGDGVARGKVLVTDTSNESTAINFDVVVAAIFSGIETESGDLEQYRDFPASLRVELPRAGEGGPTQTTSTLELPAFIRAKDGSELASFSIREKTTGNKVTLSPGESDDNDILTLEGGELSIQATTDAAIGDAVTLEIVAQHKNGNTLTVEFDGIVFYTPSNLPPRQIRTPDPIILAASASATAKFNPLDTIKDPDGDDLTLAVTSSSTSNFTVSSTADANGDYTVTRVASTSTKTSGTVNVSADDGTNPAVPFTFAVELRRTGETDTDKPTISSFASQAFNEGDSESFIQITSNFDPRTGIDVSAVPENTSIVNARIVQDTSPRTGNPRIRVYLSNFRVPAGQSQGQTRIKFVSTKQGTSLASDPAYMTVFVRKTNTPCYWVGPSSSELTFQSGTNKTLTKDRDSYCLDAEGDSREYRTPVSSNSSALSCTYDSEGKPSFTVGTVSARTEVTMSFTARSTSGDTRWRTHTVTAVIGGSAPTPREPTTSAGPNLGVDPKFYPGDHVTIYFNNYITASDTSGVIAWEQSNFSLDRQRPTDGSGNVATQFSGGSGFSSVTLRCREPGVVNFSFQAPDGETGAESQRVRGTLTVSERVQDVTPRFNPLLTSGIDVFYGGTHDLGITANYVGRDADGTQVSRANLRYTAVARDSRNGRLVTPVPFTWPSMLPASDPGAYLETGNQASILLGRTTPNTPIDEYWVTLVVYVSGKPNLRDEHTLRFRIRSIVGGPGNGGDNGNGGDDD